MQLLKKVTAKLLYQPPILEGIFGMVVAVGH